MATTRTLMPRTQFTGAYVQGPSESYDAGGDNTLVLQTWLGETLSGGEQVDVIIEHAVVNEPSAFETLMTVTYSGGGTTTGMQLTAANSTIGRFLRVRVTPSSYTGTMTVRAVAQLRQASS